MLFILKHERSETKIMTERLRQVIAQIEHLPDDAQDGYAAILQAEMEEDQQWDKTFADPRSSIVLDNLITRAKEQVARGETSDLDEIL